MIQSDLHKTFVLISFFKFKILKIYFFLNYINNIMFPDNEPEPEPNQPLFTSFEEQFGHLFRFNIGI